MRVWIAVLLLTSLTACGKKPETPKPGEPQSRPETQALRHVEAVGVPAGAIADKVDGALDANDQRKDHLDAAIDAQSRP